LGSEEQQTSHGSLFAEEPPESSGSGPYKSWTQKPDTGISTPPATDSGTHSKVSTSMPRDIDSPGLDGHMIFTFLPFLKLDHLSSMSSDDAQALEKSGSLHIPLHSTIDHFVREYFLHVHPNLPMLDEGLFWKMYTGQESSRRDPRQCSLFLFQAMLFAACSVCSLPATR
jgi:hypothetical protein